MHYRDQLVLDGRLNAVGAYIRTNVPESYRAGVELEAAGQPTARLRLAANLSVSQNRIRAFTEYRDNWDTGAQDVLTWRHTPIAYSPAVVSRIETGYAFWKQKQHRLELSLAGKYVGKQYLDNTGNDHTTLSDYAYADARLHYDWTPEGSRQRASLLLSVNNLFDAQYSNNGWTYRYTSEGYDETPFNPYARAEGNGSYNQTGFFTQAGRYWMLTLIWGIGL
jgi:iron complex outermembrane receptor protein